MAYAFALLPVCLFLGALLLMDSFKLVRPLTIVVAAVAGAGAAALCAWLYPSVISTGIGRGVAVRLVSPAIEETAKALIVVYILATRRAAFPVDAGILGFAAGTGFALLENVLYINARPDAPLTLWIIRGFGTAVLHGSSTAIYGMISQRLAAGGGARGGLAYVPGWCAAYALHAAFNLALLPPFVEMLVLLITVPLLLIYVFEWSERATREWVGAGLDLDVELLDLVTTDTFHATHFAGYLRELSARFPPLVVADMYCLLRLQLELSAQAKGKLIAQSAGLSLEPDADTRAVLEELRCLRTSIGRTGLLALAPLRVTSERDDWHRHLLGR